jgi:hypothetical protein
MSDGYEMEQAILREMNANEISTATHPKELVRAVYDLAAESELDCVFEERPGSALCRVFCTVQFEHLKLAAYEATPSVG